MRECPLCERPTRSSPFGAEDKYQLGSQPWHRCLECRTIFAERLPTDAELDAVYSQYYTHDNMDWGAVVEKRVTQIVGTFEPYRQIGRIFDVGYGSGVIPTIAQRCGWKVGGSEFAPEPLERGRASGWDVWQGEFPDLPVPAHSTDVVVMTNILEHVRHPGDYLRKAAEVLRPGGLLYMTLPCGGGLSSRLMNTKWSCYGAPEHLQLPTSSGLRSALRRNGFATCRVWAESLALGELARYVRHRETSNGLERVQSSAAINETLESGQVTRVVKRVANRVLATLDLGDQLNVYATLPGKHAS